MNKIDPLQQAVVDAAAEFATAREKLMRAEQAYSKAHQGKSTTWNAVDKSRQQNFSASAPTLTDC
jgi:inhibitor of KinA sporulation pathway (predicted exonuclease)